MKKKFLVSAGAAVAAVALVASASPAAALVWPNSGYFQITGTSGGGAMWQIDDYGLAYGWDVNEDMNESLYYPLAIYTHGEYLKCGESVDGSDATLTEEANGDITIDCQPVTDTFATGLTGTLHIRLYAEDENGYMARVWGELENTTNSTIEIGSDDPIGVYYYYNYSAWDNGDPWMTNVGGGDDGLDGSFWGAGGDFDMYEIATSSSWGSESQACRFTAAPNGMYVPAESNSIAAGETVNIVAFINMVFPVGDDDAETQAAFDAALAHAQGELAGGLTGRMATGLPADLVASGWETNDACVPQLANTGVDTAVTGGIAAGAGALALLGLGLVVARRRARV
jgi:LPXTG-motif cell wall-anchored protein